MALLARLSVQAPPALPLLVAALRFEDVVSLFVYALETGAACEDDDGLAALRRFLRFHERRFALHDATLLRVAVAHRCFRATRHLLSPQDGPTGLTVRRAVHFATAPLDPGLTWLDRYHPRIFGDEVMETAARRGDLSLVQWLHGTCDYATWTAMEAAAAAGNLEVAYWLVRHQETAVRAVGHGNPRVHVLASLSSAVQNPTVELVHWSVWIPKRVTQDEVMYKHRRVFATKRHFVVENGLDDEDGAALFDAMEFAVTKRDKELLRMIHEDAKTHAWPTPAEALHTAARNGAVELVRWLHEEYRMPLDDGVVEQALRSGSLALLQWLETQHCFKYSPKALKYLCDGGSLESAQWICERWPELRLDRPLSMSLHANIDVLHYLCDQGRIAPSAWMLNKAAMEGRLDIVEWCLLVLPREDTEGQLVSAFKHAAAKGYLLIVERLYPQTREAHGTGFDLASLYGCVNVVRFMLQQSPRVRQQVPFRHITHNARFGRFDMVRLLLEEDLVASRARHGPAICPLVRVFTGFEETSH